MTEVPKCISIGYISFIHAGSVSSGETEGILSTLKKATGPEGETYPYIAGQSIRRMLRERLKDEGFEISPLQKGEPSKRTGEPVPVSSGEPKNYVDDDLFGYMIARQEEKGPTKKRTGPVRASHCVSLHPWKFDIEFGVGRGEEEKGITPSPYETEVARGFFAGSFLIELDRIGRFQGIELGEKDPEKIKELDTDKKLKRLVGLIKAIRYMWGGGKQSRMLTDVSPVLVVYARQTMKNPIFLNALYVNEAGNLDIELLKEAVANGEMIQKAIFGVKKWPIANVGELREEDIFEGKGFLPINKAFENIDNDITSDEVKEALGG